MTLEDLDFAVEEAESATSAAAKIAARPPDVIVLDVGLPGKDGLTFCRELKNGAATQAPRIVVLTGSAAGTESAARAVGADALLAKPFGPLELLTVVERLARGIPQGPFREPQAGASDEQLFLYARDLRRLLEIERGQRELLQRAYRQTVTALAGVLESKDTGTKAHSQRVQRYAMELAAVVEPRLLEDRTIEYGFLLHDIGKIGIPDTILAKRGALTPRERGVVETHTVLGEQMLGDVALLQGEGLKVVRSHHERWDGNGYPDRLAGGDSAFRPGLHGRRRARRDDERPALPAGRKLGRRRARDRGRVRTPVRSGRRRRLSRSRAAPAPDPVRANGGLTTLTIFRRA
jgi:response regulator RpfG family c-di-GMP phosphodiesterase